METITHPRKNIGWFEKLKIKRANKRYDTQNPYKEFDGYQGDRGVEIKFPVNGEKYNTKYYENPEKTGYSMLACYSVPDQVKIRMTSGGVLSVKFYYRTSEERPDARVFALKKREEIMARVGRYSGKILELRFLGGGEIIRSGSFDIPEEAAQKIYAKIPGTGLTRVERQLALVRKLLNDIDPGLLESFRVSWENLSQVKRRKSGWVR